MLKNLIILMTVMFEGFIYYKLSVSKNNKWKNLAFRIKIVFLVLSFILAFIEQDRIVLGGLAFGGRTSVMMLVLFEIIDAFIDKKNKSFK